MQTASCLVAAQPKGTRVPLFLVAGFQGPDDTLFVLSRIIPHLSPDQPVYGLKPRWTDGGKLYLDVEEEAAEYLAALRTVQPKGPYLLGGYCLSGLVALEMARQLLADGEQIGLLALIDTERPTTSRRMAANLWNAGVRALHIAAVIRDAFRFNDRARSAAARDLIWRQMRIRRTEAPSNENLYYRSKMSYQRIIREYVVNQYPGRITLIVNETFHSIDRHRGWRDIPVGELAVKKVPGDHITMFTEHGAVSYTHLDVYKRQEREERGSHPRTGGRARLVLGDVIRGSSQRRSLPPSYGRKKQTDDPTISKWRLPMRVRVHRSM